MSNRAITRSPSDRIAEDWINSKFDTPEGVPVPIMWWFSKLYKGSAAAALADINAACGTNYPRRRFREWERGQTKMPENMRKYVIQEVMRAKLGKKVAQTIITFLDISFEEPAHADFI